MPNSQTRLNLLSRLLALFLSVSLTFPNPAFDRCSQELAAGNGAASASRSQALRTRNAGLEERTAVTDEIEKALLEGRPNPTAQLVSAIIPAATPAHPQQPAAIAPSVVPSAAGLEEGNKHFVELGKDARLVYDELLKTAAEQIRIDLRSFDQLERYLESSPKSILRILRTDKISIIRSPLSEPNHPWLDFHMNPNTYNEHLLVPYLKEVISRPETDVDSSEISNLSIEVTDLGVPSPFWGQIKNALLVRNAGDGSVDIIIKSSNNIRDFTAQIPAAFAVVAWFLKRESGLLPDDGPEEGAEYSINLDRDALYRIPRHLRDFLRVVIIPKLFGVTVNGKKVTLSEDEVLLQDGLFLQEIQAWISSSASAQRFLNLILEKSKQGNVHDDLLRWVNAYFLLPRGMALFSFTSTDIDRSHSVHNIYGSSPFPVGRF